MKFIQIVHKYAPYISYFEEKYEIEKLQPNFETLRRMLIDDGFYGPHILQPIFDNNPEAFYTMWDYERLQYLWAKENGLNSTDLSKILKAQIQKFSPEVIYNMSPQKISVDDLDEFRANSKLICWNADPYSIHDESLAKYNALLTSSVNKTTEEKNAYLHYPACDPLMLSAKTTEKPVDVFFYGQYDGKPFEERRKFITELIPFFQKNNIQFCFALMYKQSKKLKHNIPFLRRFDFAWEFDPPKKLTSNFSKTIFGKDIYQEIAKSKIVFNISAENENFGDFKFNMRIFETLGTGTFMLSDKGKYPPNIVDGRDFASYENIEDLKEKILYFLNNEEEREEIAKQGFETVRQHYSKEKQWENFCKIVETL